MPKTGQLNTVTTELQYAEEYAKLENAAEAMGMQLIPNEGGGDCQFLAITHQVKVLHGKDFDIATLRHMAANLLLQQEERYIMIVYHCISCR